jgi:hypothetical protein
MQTNCVAYAKVVKNERLHTLRLVATFDIAANKVTVRNAAYVSGDLCNMYDSAEYIEHTIAQAMQAAKSQMRTDNIVLL